MIRKPLDLVDEAVLAELVANQVAEGRSLEFKRDLPGGADGDIKEFLADVTSLANAQGGDLVFGISEQDGVASEIRGLTVENADSALLRLENILRDGVEPRLSGTRFRWVELAGGTSVLLVRVPSSLAAPHRVRFKNSARFYSRNSRGKYEMDTHELRVAFTASEQMPARLRELHFGAVRAAKGADLPFRIYPGPTAVISIMPLTFFREARDIAITPDNILVPPRVTSGLNYLHMLEGIVMTTPEKDGAVRSYALTHRTGRVDAAWSIGAIVEQRGTTMNLVWPKHFKEGVVSMARAATTRLRSYGIEGPWVAFVSVFGIKDFWISLPDGEHSEDAWRDEASLPELISDELDEASLRPILNAFSLLFGMPHADYVYRNS